MNRGTLPILSRLRSLQTTSRFAAGGARVIADADDRNPLAQLLRTTNETMLGRSLQFDSASGPSLTLDVSGRRVLRLTAAIGLPGAERCLGVEVLEDEHKDDLIKLLQALAVPRYELRVTSGPIGRGGEEVSVGLPVALLADLLLVDLNGADEDEAEAVGEESFQPEPAASASLSGTSLGVGSDGLTSFAESVGPELVAWLVVGQGTVGGSGGAEEMVSHLQTFLEDERNAIDRQLDILSDAPGAPCCIALGATLVEGHSIICARLGGDMLLGIVEGDGTGAALAAWRRVLAG